jgi:hypothetical protein
MVAVSLALPGAIMTSSVLALLGSTLFLPLIVAYLLAGMAGVILLLAAPARRRQHPD